MRTKNYLWAVLAAATLSLNACVSGENEMTEPQPQGKTAELKITVQGAPVTNTKSTGASLPGATTDENTVKRIAIGIFNPDGSVNAIKEFTATTGISINCTPANGCSGVAVANAPANHFAGVTTSTDFLARTVTLGQDATELPMTGEILDNSTSANTFNLTAGNPTNVKVDLERLVARVSISGIKTDFDPSGQYANATFTAKQIFLHNAKTTSDVSTGAPATSDLKTGWDDQSVTADHIATLKDDISGGLTITSSPTTDHYWFYTFPNDNTASTRLVIRGDFDPDGSGSTAAVDVYYPVVVNLAQTGTTINSGAKDGTIARNTTYAITATIKGKGAPNPNANMNPATLNLSVTVAGWALNITQNVEFN